MDDLDVEIKREFEKRGWVKYYPREKADSVRIEDDIIRIRISQPFYLDTNCYLITGDEPTLVDPGHGYDTSHLSLISGLEKEGMSLNDISQVIITHPHVDHASGLVRLNGQAGFERMAFEDTVAQYNDYGVFLKKAREKYSKKVKFMCDSGIFSEEQAMGYPEVYYQRPGMIGFTRGLSHGEKIKMGSHKWIVLHAPGHCPHHLVFFNEERGIMITGDIFIGKATSLGDIGPYLNSLKMLKGLDVGLILPAHGRPFKDPAMTIEEARTTIEERIKFVSELIASERDIQVWEIVRRVFGEQRRIYRSSTSLGMILGILKFLKEQGEDVRYDV